MTSTARRIANMVSELVIMGLIVYAVYFFFGATPAYIVCGIFVALYIFGCIIATQQWRGENMTEERQLKKQNYLRYDEEDWEEERRRQQEEEEHEERERQYEEERKRIEEENEREREAEERQREEEERRQRDQEDQE